jgi:peroxiredoxin
LCEAETELGELDVSVAVVTFDAGPLAENYVKQSGLSWPLLVDPDRELYAAYGIERAGNWKLYRPSVIWEHIKLLLKGRRLGRPGRDVHQLGGDVLIDPAGTVRMHYVSQDPADRPSVESILDTVRTAETE